MRANRAIVFCLVALSVYFGCAEIYLGKTVPEDDRIPLIPGKTNAGTWEAFEYTMAYQYNFHPGSSGLPGKIALNGEVSTRGVAILDIWVNFLDAQGKVLAREGVFSSGFLLGVKFNSFEVSLETPPGTSAISFTHIARERKPKD